MQSVEEAIRQVAEAAGAVRPRREQLPLADALGRVLAADVVMDHDVPPFDRATMDGFAMREVDATPGARLPLVGVVAAGDAPGIAVPPGSAVAIMTGAPVPAGVDFVVPFEWAERTAEHVTLNEIKWGPNIAAQGSHIRQADVVASAGQVLTPAALGALASAGAAQVTVAARPRVAILGTGSELVPIDEAPGPGRIRNSNAYALAGQARRVGAVPIDLGFAVDDRAALAAKVAEGLEADVLLLSGGVSMGDFDLVPSVLAEAGVEQVFHRWSVQPGGPLWFGVGRSAKGDTTLVVGLPGNPAATFVGFELLVVPALRAFVGLPVTERRTLRARYEGDWGKPKPRRRYRPVTLASQADGVLVARPMAWRGSGDPFVFATADGLVVLPEDTPAPEEPAPVLEVVPVSDVGLLWGSA